MTIQLELLENGEKHKTKMEELEWTKIGNEKEEKEERKEEENGKKFYVKIKTEETDIFNYFNFFHDSVKKFFSEMINLNFQKKIDFEYYLFNNGKVDSFHSSNFVVDHLENLHDENFKKKFRFKCFFCGSTILFQQFTKECPHCSSTNFMIEKMFAVLELKSKKFLFFIFYFFFIILIFLILFFSFIFLFLFFYFFYFFSLINWKLVQGGQGRIYHSRLKNEETFFAIKELLFEENRANWEREIEILKHIEKEIPTFATPR